MITGRVNNEEIRNAHWIAFINLMSVSSKQVPLFAMSNEEYVEFESYVKSPEFEFLAQMDAKLMAARHI